MTNALWISRLCAYKQSNNSLETAAIIVNTKINRRTILLRQYKIKREISIISQMSDIQTILLHEARVAKNFWTSFRILLPDWVQFPGRKPRSLDIVNRLLDIGYHHITNKTKSIIQDKEVSSAMGLLHQPRTATSAPLAYDLVELFRADLVDAEVLRFLRLKKKPLEKLNQKHISHFLSQVNKRIEKKHYLKDFKQCHTYGYYMELQIVKFIKAVNHNEVYRPLHLPARHDTRCS